MSVTPERWVDEHGDAMYRYALKHVRNTDVAADLVQETYLKAMKAEHRFELRGMGVRPWLFRILHNNFYSRVAKRKRQPTLGDDLPEIEVDGHVGGDGEPAWNLQSLDWEQVDDRLKAAVAELPEHYREVLLLWAVEVLKYREIADVLDVTMGTVMSRLYRARAILTEQLADLAKEHGMTATPRSTDA